MAHENCAQLEVIEADICDQGLLKFFKLAARSPILLLGSGENKYHLVHGEDWVQGFILAPEIEHAIGESFIIGSDDVFLLNQLLVMISIIMDKTSHKMLKLPIKPFQVLGSISENIAIPLGVEPSVYRRRIAFFDNGREFKISKAQKLLGFKPAYSTHAGLEQTYHWFKQQGLF